MSAPKRQRKGRSNGKTAPARKRRGPQKVTEVFEDCTITMHGNRASISGPLADEMAALAQQLGKSADDVFIECIRAGLPELRAKLTAQTAKLKKQAN